MTDIEKIEKLLREYPVLRSKLHIKIIQNNDKIYSLPAQDYSKVAVGNPFFSAIEEFVILKTQLEEETLELFRKVRAIEEGLKCLTKMQYDCVKLRYFKGLSNLEIGLEVDRSEKTVRRYIKIALKKLQKTGLHEIVP